MAERDALPLPLDIRARIAELELELSEGEWRFSLLSRPTLRRLRWWWNVGEAKPDLTDAA